MKAYRAPCFDMTESKSLINLPFTVKSFILNKHNMSWGDDSTQMLYIRLRAAEDQYGVINDEDVFCRITYKK